MANIGPDSLFHEKSDSAEVSFPIHSLHEDTTFREAIPSNFLINGPPPKVLVSFLFLPYKVLGKSLPCHCGVKSKLFVL